MNILHTEASNGWGGQEIRILKEALGMRKRGHEIFFVVTSGGILAEKAREKGFTVYELPFEKKKFYRVIPKLIRIIKEHQIDLINTHSSIDSWLAGIAGKMTSCPVIRTRHISAPVKKGVKSRFLYGRIADSVVTTCEEVAERISRNALVPKKRCRSIPTGVNFEEFSTDENLRKSLNLSEEDFVVGTLCILRSWKGLGDFIEAANLLKEQEGIKWVIAGNGPQEEALKQKVRELGLEELVLFTGFIENPEIALNTFDVFALLSTKNEGVSQASLQAAYLKKPLITTSCGGLPEVCLAGETGFIVSTSSPEEVAKYVMKLKDNPELRMNFGEKGRELVMKNFTLEGMLDQMEEVYEGVSG